MVEKVENSGLFQSVKVPTLDEAGLEDPALTLEAIQEAFAIAAQSVENDDERNKEDEDGARTEREADSDGSKSSSHMSDDYDHS
jgi:hypothetical protein